MWIGSILHYFFSNLIHIFIIYFKAGSQIDLIFAILCRWGLLIIQWWLWLSSSQPMMSTPVTAAQVTTCAASPTGQATQPMLSQLSSPTNLIQTSSVTTSLPLSLTNHSSLASPPSQPKVASIIPQNIMQTTTTDGLPPNVSQLLPSECEHCFWTVLSLLNYGMVNRMSLVIIQ